MQINMSMIYPKVAIEVSHSNDIEIDEFDVPILIKLCKGMWIALSLEDAEELADKLNTTIESYKTNIVKYNDEGDKYYATLPR